MDPSEDIAARAQWGISRLAGADEVGRGPWAGPVTAAAVILNPDHVPDGLRDSKTLTKKRREALDAEIRETALAVQVVHIGRDVIDQINILQASLSAMRQAIERLSPAAEAALIDGRYVPDGLACPAVGLVKGDARSPSIAAASIVAKVARDEIMVALAQQYPAYGWATNAGYGTPEHQRALSEHGVTPHHRRSFKPIHNILWPQK